MSAIDRPIDRSIDRSIERAIVHSIVREKSEQAGVILEEFGIDCWLTFVRETTESGDPVLPLILGQALTWQSALLITRAGDRIAIVGKFDDGAVRSTGVWTEVTGYVQSIRDSLLEALSRIDPEKIAINYSKNDVKADGLTHGMFEILCGHLEGTPWRDRLCSAEGVIGALRGRKTPGEIDRIRQAIATTSEIFRHVAQTVKPGWTERAVSDFMHEEILRRRLEPAWEWDGCPIVTTGPDSMVGHGRPSEELTVHPGGIFHLDFGVREEEYCADLQRCWWVPEALAQNASAQNRSVQNRSVQNRSVQNPSAEIPSEVQRGFGAVQGAIAAAFEAVRPGVEAWTVDAAARQHLISAGYDEYQHATGHQVGRAAHDGATVLGPKWERYGRAPYNRVEVGNVFTLELGIENLDGRGYLGLEEMIVVTPDGAQWLSEPQSEMWILGA